MFPNRRFVHLLKLGEALVVNDRLDRLQPFPVRRRLHRVLQSAVGFQRLTRDQFLGFILDTNDLANGPP